ncbi:hypothetical protein RhiJN_24130 [Ceratobasidium sp. AG-Ba]|nr:hypothetical protein RhiJN_24130 [Ceratobasidium sp. AG-Ba]
MAGLAGILSTYLFHMVASRNLTFAGYVVLLYDHLLTLGDEIELIWSRPGNPVSIIFLMNRYLTPLVLAIDIYVIIPSADKGGLARNLTVRFCRTWFLTDAYYNFVLLASIHALMVMRVNAFWGNSAKLRRWLIGAFVLYLTSTLGVLTSALHGTVVTVQPETLLIHTCWGQIVDYMWTIWIPAILLECMIFTLTAIRAWQLSHSPIARMQLPLVKTLYRDGFQYFIVIVLCSFFPLFVWVKAPMSLAAMPNDYKHYGFPDHPQYPSV